MGFAMNDLIKVQQFMEWARVNVPDYYNILRAELAKQNVPGLSGFESIIGLVSSVAQSAASIYSSIANTDAQRKAINAQIAALKAGQTTQAANIAQQTGTQNLAPATGANNTNLLYGGALILGLYFLFTHA